MPTAHETLAANLELNRKERLTVHKTDATKLVREHTQAVRAGHVLQEALDVALAQLPPSFWRPHIQDTRPGQNGKWCQTCGLVWPCGGNDAPDLLRPFLRATTKPEEAPHGA